MTFIGGVTGYPNQCGSGIKQAPTELVTGQLMRPSMLAVAALYLGAI